jgi:adenosylhomocysteine nucleosidase
MKRTVLILTSLACEATPLRKAWELSPLRENPLGERFQVFQRDGIYLGVSGIGKVRSAIATSALLSGLFEPHYPPIAINLGIAGASITQLARGTLVYINKVRDAATNTRLYPDILLRHNLPEFPLDTFDHPVTTPPSDAVVVDMEGSGFMQAVTALSSPSLSCLLKVISDHCDGTRCTPEDASTLIRDNLPAIEQIVSALRSELTDPPTLTQSEREILALLTTHASLSLSQRIELNRLVESLKAQGAPFIERLRSALETPVTTKEERNTFYRELVHGLTQEVSL